MIQSCKRGTRREHTDCNLLTGIWGQCVSMMLKNLMLQRKKKQGKNEKASVFVLVCGRVSSGGLATGRSNAEIDKAMCGSHREMWLKQKTVRKLRRKGTGWCGWGWIAWRKTSWLFVSVFRQSFDKGNKNVLNKWKKHLPSCIFKRALLFLDNILYGSGPSGQVSDNWLFALCASFSKSDRQPLQY